MQSSAAAVVAAYVAATAVAAVAVAVVGSISSLSRAAGGDPLRKAALGVAE